MGLYLESFITEIILSVIFIDILILLYFFYSYKYWERKDIPYIKPTFPFGNLKTLVLRQKTLGLGIYDIYKEFKKRGVKYGGYFVFAKPTFIPMDPEIIKQIIIKDFNQFQDRGVYYNEEIDPLSAHLFSVAGQKWRHLRVKLSPTFTSGKMKMMFNIFVGTGKVLEEILEEVSSKGEPIDIKEIAARFTTDIISSCAFGLECNSLKNPDAEFRKQGRKIFEIGFIEGIKIALSFTLPSVLHFFNVHISKPDVAAFFLDAVKQTIEYREKNNIDRQDMLSLLMKLKNNENIDDENPTNGVNGKTVENGISFNDLAAQCFVFYVGGFETSSTTMTFALLELCLNQDVQDKLREEIRSVLKKYKGEITYEAINEMTYMDKVINETLRKYPAVPLLNRECNQDWTIPGTNKVIEKGTAVVISNYGLQMDPEYFPNPEKFDPERFSEEAKAKRPAFAYLPFGDGPRNCIGMRFGLLQTKIGLSVFLKNNKYKLHPKTKLPVIFDVNVLVLSHRDGVWLQSERI